MSEGQRKLFTSKKINDSFNNMCDLFNGKIGSIRGHFWVELEDGTIIDPHFEVYDAIKYMKNLEGDRIYRECDSEIQKDMIRRSVLKPMTLLLRDYKDDVKRLTSYTKDAEFEGLSNDSYENGYCHMNAMINKIIYGKTARICYGDMGWAFMGQPNKIFYEYEHGWDGKHDNRCDIMEIMERLQKRPDMLKLLMKTHMTNK